MPDLVQIPETNLLLYICTAFMEFIAPWDKKFKYWLSENYHIWEMQYPYPVPKIIDNI